MAYFFLLAIIIFQKIRGSAVKVLQEQRFLIILQFSVQQYPVGMHFGRKCIYYGLIISVVIDVGVYRGAVFTDRQRRGNYIQYCQGCGQQAGGGNRCKQLQTTDQRGRNADAFGLHKIIYRPVLIFAVVKLPIFWIIGILLNEIHLAASFPND